MKKFVVSLVFLVSVGFFGSTIAYAACPDGILDPGEDCDDNNLLNFDGCSAICTDETCGNGTCEAWVGETTPTCSADCPGTCGDGFCDAGAGETTSSCSGDCGIAGICCVAGVDNGDVGSAPLLSPSVCVLIGGVVEPGPSCTPVSVCGDSVCDYISGAENGTSCPGDCPATGICCIAGVNSGQTAVYTPYIAPSVCNIAGGVVEAGPTCSAGPACGNGICQVGIGENPFTCPADCGPPPVCGDGVVGFGEGCDLGAGNGVCPSACSATCAPNFCACTPGGPCDDGNACTGGDVFDGVCSCVGTAPLCNSCIGLTCVANTSFTTNLCTVNADCVVPGVCGNGILEVGEACDNGVSNTNTCVSGVSSTECTTSCTVMVCNNCGLQNCTVNETCNNSDPNPVVWYCEDCADGIQNNGETGLDCGGPNCGACAPTCPTVNTGNACSVGAGVCQANGVLVCSGAGVDTCSATVPACATVPNPLAMAKSVGAIVNNGNGTYNVPFTIILQNTSTFLTLENVQAVDNMFTTFGAGFTSVISNVVTNNVIGSTALAANPGYNGNGVSNLLAAAGTMAPGARATITLTVLVTPSGNLGNPVPYFNQATMQGTLFNAATGIRNATVQSDLSDNGNNPDANGNGFGGDVGENDPTPVSFVETGLVGVAKAAGTIVDNGNGTYDIPLSFVVKNMGNTVLNNIQLTDSLVTTFGAVPYTLVSLSASGGYVTNGGYNGNGNVNLLSGTQSLPIANTVLINLVVRITPGVTPGPWTNTAVGSGTTPGLTTVTDTSTNGANPDPNNDGNPIENTPTPIAIPASVPLIGVAKQASTPTSVGGGQYDVTYLFTVTNYGNTNLTNISLPENFNTVFPLPATWTLVGAPVATAPLIANPGYTGTPGSPNLLSGASALPIGATRTVAVTVRVTPGVNAGPYVNTVVVTGTPPVGPVVTDTSTNGVNPDANNNGNPNDDNTPTPVTFPFSADLSLTKTSSLATVHNTDTVSFTLTLTNNGPSPTTGVVVQDLLPAAYTYLSHSPGVELYNQGTGQWNVGNMAIGEVRTLVINAQVANASLPLTNTAEVTASTTPDPDSTPGDGTGDDFATVTPVGRALVDLSLTKTVSPGAVNVGQNVTFTITLTNSGPDNSLGAVVTDYLPAGYAFVSATPATGLFFPGPNTWGVFSLASGASTTLTIVATVLPVGPYQNAAEVTGVSGSPDDPDSTPNNGPNGEDDYATATPVVNGTTDLAMTKTISSGTPLVGSNVTFTVTVTNQSGVNATGVQVMDQLPSGYSYVSHTASVGTYVPGSGSWTVGSVAATTSEVLTIVATVLPTGNYANFTQVMNSSPVDIDSTPGNSNFVPGEDDWASATPTPVPVFGLTLSKTVNNATPGYLSNVVFTVSVLNNGPSVAPATVISDLLPVGLTYVSHVAGSGTYVPGTGAWTTAAIPVGTTVTLQITARVDTRNAVTNIASVPSIPAVPPAPVTVTPLLATVTGHLFQDDNENGVQNGNEDDLDDISVTITDATGVPQTVVTDNNGNYSVQVAPGIVTAVIDQNDNDFPDKYIITVGAYSVTVNAPVSVSTPAHYFGIDPKSGKNDDDKKKKRSITVVIQRRLAATGFDLGAGQTLATVALLAIGGLNMRRSRRSDV